MGEGRRCVSGPTCKPGGLRFFQTNHLRCASKSALAITLQRSMSFPSTWGGRRERDCFSPSNWCETMESLWRHERRPARVCDFLRLGHKKFARHSRIALKRDIAVSGAHGGICRGTSLVFKNASKRHAPECRQLSQFLGVGNAKVGVVVAGKGLPANR